MRTIPHAAYNNHVSGDCSIIDMLDLYIQLSASRPYPTSEREEPAWATLLHAQVMCAVVMRRHMHAAALPVECMRGHCPGLPIVN
jgi:hypothetical protein